MRVLVTGAAGYIGCVLCRELLAHGHQVVALDNLRRGGHGLLPLVGHSGFSFVRGRAQDGAVLERLVPTVDAIVPLAGIVGLSACDRDPDAARMTNFYALYPLLAHRRGTDPQPILFPMTNSAYGRCEGMCTEESPFTPLSWYAKTKARAEEQIRYAENAVSFRLATVFGVSPNQRWDLLVNDFVRRAVRDRVIALYGAGARRNYVHVRDVAEGFRWGLENFDRLKAGKVYNLGNDALNCTKGQLAGLVATHTGCQLVPCAGEDPDQRDYEVSSAKLAAAGFQARRTVDEALDELVTAAEMCE